VAIFSPLANEKLGGFAKRQKAFDKGQSGAYREILNPERASLTGGCPPGGEMSFRSAAIQENCRCAAAAKTVAQSR
jgi:hypothetical protein